MKKFLYALAILFLHLQAMAQKQVQPLQPSRVSIFKNGTSFIKREAVVAVKDNIFYIPAPQNLLLGTWWLAIGKEASLASIVVKEDTIKNEKYADHLYGYLMANIGENITLNSSSFLAPNLKQLTGKLLEFNPVNFTLKMKLANGNIIITSASDFNSLELNEKNGTKYLVDSIIYTAKVKLTRSTASTTASTISLEKGIQWYPSYLFTPVNDKEGKLEMKATIVNGDMNFINTPVDIIIGNPEMFYGKELDPVYTDYLTNKLLGGTYENNFQALSFNTAISSNSANGWSYGNSTVGSASDEAGDGETEEKYGEKSEDLYYYQLGNIDLEKNARVIVPVVTSNVSYKEMYTAHLDEISSESTSLDPIEVYHNYKITNSTNAPFTSGVVLILNQQKQPFAQSKIDYTPAKGNTDIKLSKAIDVQVKNEEEEIKREKVASPKKEYTQDKITYKGSINITNYQEKAITIKITKSVDGSYTQADNDGFFKKLKNVSRKDVGYALWEVTIKPNASIQLNYQYFSIK